MKSEVSELLRRIGHARTRTERQSLLSRLEELADANEGLPFYYLWMRIHDTWKFDSWSDDGFHPVAVPLPRNVQLLTATHYGINDIGNGGFPQFFGNGTGVFAPEMIEWFDLAGMPDAAEVLRRAVARFGHPYPRSQDGRRSMLEELERQSQDDENPFYDLEEPFDETLDGRTSEPFDVVANRWLRKTCGINSLSDPPRFFDRAE